MCKTKIKVFFKTEEEVRNQFAGKNIISIVRGTYFKKTDVYAFEVEFEIPERKISYEKLVSKYIREKYSQDKVEAILSNYLVDSSNDEYKKEFDEFQLYRNECKNKAKEFVAEREEALNNG